MVAVALIGVDGAGKTTIADKLRAEFAAPVKYLYMGTSVQSSNYALPTTRLILHLKRRAHAKKTRAGAGEPTAFVEHPQRRRGRLGATASLLNQLAEEWYRQCVSWVLQARGYLVLYDRHFLFEHWVPAAERAIARPRLTERLHLWMLQYAYPKPDLTLFLDAPVEVLHKRKEEQTVDRLRRHREAIVEVGRTLDGFVRIDASLDVEAVYEQVTRAILGRRANGA